MKIGTTAKERIRLKPVGHSWILIVDQKPLISTPDRHWLRRFAVQVRQSLAGEKSFRSVM